MFEPRKDKNIEHKFKQDMSFAFSYVIMLFLFLLLVHFKGLATIPIHPLYAQDVHTYFKIMTKND